MTNFPTYPDYVQLRGGAQRPPPDPHAGGVRIYADETGALRTIQSDGTDAPIGGGGGGTSRTVRLVLIADGTAVASGEDFASYDFIVGSDLNGLSLTSISWFVKTGSSSGAPSFAVRKNAATEMLSTNCTIDANELTSDTAVTPPVINGANAAVATGDVLHFDCDAAGTGTKGSEVRMTFA